MIAEEKISLWCLTCQRGLCALNAQNIYSVGDTCPLCLKKGRGEQADVLMDANKAESDHLERADFIKKEAAKKALKGIKPADVKVKELQMEYEARIRKLESKLDEKPAQATKTRAKRSAKVEEVTGEQSS